MPEFESFDSRGYSTVDARTGYAEWAGARYDETVVDAITRPAGTRADRPSPPLPTRSRRCTAATTPTAYGSRVPPPKPPAHRCGPSRQARRHESRGKGRSAAMAVSR